MKIKLKPFYIFDPQLTPPCVKSELMYIPLADDEVALVRQLVDGIDAATVTPEQFKLIERFNERDLITFADHPLYSLIGLHEIDMRRGLEVLNTVKVKITDLTGEHGEYFKETLKELGVNIVQQDPSLEIVITDSHTRVPKATCAMMPVVMNRFRPSIGPLHTPERNNMSAMTKKNPRYLETPNVPLPKAFYDLHRAWACVLIFQFILKSDTSKVDIIHELNMFKMKQEHWPVKL